MRPGMIGLCAYRLENRYHGVVTIPILGTCELVGSLIWNNYPWAGGRAGRGARSRQSQAAAGPFCALTCFARPVAHEHSNRNLGILLDIRT